MALACWTLSLPGTHSTPAGVAESSDRAKLPDDAKAADRDRQSRRMVLGTWEDDYQGKRTMTLREDGAGTMIVELSGVKATLFAARLQFDLTWSLEGGRLRVRTTGGEPADKAALILQVMGDSVNHAIVELDDDRLVLRDDADKTTYHWRRVR